MLENSLNSDIPQRRRGRRRTPRIKRIEICLHLRSSALLEERPTVEEIASEHGVSPGTAYAAQKEFRQVSTGALESELATLKQQSAPQDEPEGRSIPTEAGTGHVQPDQDTTAHDSIRRRA